MSRQTTTFIGCLALVAMISFSLWPVWAWLTAKSVQAEVQARIQRLAEKDAKLKAAYNIALQDGTLSPDEAKEILEAAGEKPE